jgi:hypothetical protein
MRFKMTGIVRQASTAFLALSMALPALAGDNQSPVIVHKGDQVKIAPGSSPWTEPPTKGFCFCDEGFIKDFSDRRLTTRPAPAPKRNPYLKGQTTGQATGQPGFKVSVPYKPGKLVSQIE